jgi:hypothetical protein
MAMLLYFYRCSESLRRGCLRSQPDRSRVANWSNRLERRGCFHRTHYPAPVRTDRTG